jgi:[acyl-carrier-protein] S-malonyltransferase
VNNKLAFVFPGQGSQKVGMLGELAIEHSIIKQTFAEASDILDYDLWSFVQQGPQEDLNITEKTQPLLLTASVALWRLWQQHGLAQPEYLAGHSLGEFTALVCAQSIQFADAVKLVQQRGQFMQSAVPIGVGAMAAIIGLEDDKINQACRDAAQGECVAAVNFNSPGQVVIAGTAGAVERAIAACKAAGAKRAMSLPVSAPFHTTLMQPAGEKLSEALALLTVKAPQIPVIHNVHAKIESDPVKIKALLVEQISSPVQWVLCVRALANNGIAHAVECGPGNVLSGLMRRIDKSISAGTIDTVAGFEKAAAAIAKL